MTEIHFTKMHGCGNDFVLVDCIKEPVNGLDKYARKLAHRRFGVGADQILTVAPSNVADFKMEIYNADGSQVEMCGNGIRCLAKYVYERGLTEKKELQVETLGGIVRPRIVGNLVEVDMGEPILEGRKIPVNADGQVINYPLDVDGTKYEVSCVSIGNPHCIVYPDAELDHLDLEGIGPRFEYNAFFPNRVNTEFAEVVKPDEVRMRVWERGAGETWACGSGACAVAVAGVLTGRTARRVTIHVLGGDLKIEWRHDNHVYMTGGAEEVFEGTVRVEP